MKKEYRLGRKLIGTLDGDTFRKEVLLSRHLFRVLNAWGVDSSTLRKLPEHCKIELHELEEDKWYRTTKEEFLELGTQYLHFKQPREDFKTQLFLKREHWKIEKPTPLTKEQIEENNYRMASGLEKKYL